MAGVLLEVLRSFGDGAPGADVTGDLGACLVLGEQSCGRSSLLYLAAGSAAGRPGGRVLFLAPSPVQALPAPLLRLEPRSLRRIQFAYPRSAEALLEALASLHHSPAALPSLILLDRLDHYLPGGCGPDTAAQAALIAALLRDSAAWITQKLQPSAECQDVKSRVVQLLQAPSDLLVQLNGVVSGRYRAGPRDLQGANQWKQSSIHNLHREICALAQDETAADLGLHIIERYFPVKCVVKEEPCKSEGARSYLISFCGLVKDEPEGTCAPQSVEDSAWELTYEADNVTRIHPVTREKRESEETHDA